MNIKDTKRETAHNKRASTVEMVLRSHPADKGINHVPPVLHTLAKGQHMLAAIAQADRIIKASNKANQENKIDIPKHAKQIEVYGKLGITPQKLEVEVPAGDASTLILYICKTLHQYARFERIEDIITIALWAAGTWFVEPTEQGMINGQLCFEAFARLFLIGKPGAGKNRLMKILRKIVRNPTVIGTIKVTSYGVARALEDGMTVMIDEYHKRVGTQGTRNTDLQEAVLAYSREAGSIDGKGGKYNEYAAFGPVIIAAQPQIESGNRGEELTDLFDRSFIIRMVEHEDPDDVIPDLDEDFEKKCADIRGCLELWAAGVYQTILAGKESKRYTPIHDLPPNLTGRQREISIPLCFVADIAVNPAVLAEEGSDTAWAKQARNAVQVLLLGHGNSMGQAMDRLKGMFEEDTSLADLNPPRVGKHRKIL